MEVPIYNLFLCDGMYVDQKDGIRFDATDLLISYTNTKLFNYKTTRIHYWTANQKEISLRDISFAAVKDEAIQDMLTTDALVVVEPDLTKIDFLDSSLIVEAIAKELPVFILRRDFDNKVILYNMGQNLASIDYFYRAVGTLHFVNELLGVFSKLTELNKVD